MKLNKRQAAFAISALAVFVLALVLTILEWSGVFTVCSHPILMFFLVAAAGLGVILAVQGFLGKSPFRFFLSAVMFLYVASYCLRISRIWYGGSSSLWTLSSQSSLS